MIDGSVKFFSQDIDVNTVMRAVNSINNGEPVPQF